MMVGKTSAHAGVASEVGWNPGGFAPPIITAVGTCRSWTLGSKTQDILRKSFTILSWTGTSWLPKFMMNYSVTVTVVLDLSICRDCYDGLAFGVQHGGVCKTQYLQVDNTNVARRSRAFSGCLCVVGLHSVPQVVVQAVPFGSKRRPLHQLPGYAEHVRRRLGREPQDAT